MVREFCESIKNEAPQGGQTEQGQALPKKEIHMTKINQKQSTGKEKTNGDTRMTNAQIAVTTCAFYHRLNGCCMPSHPCSLRDLCQHLVGQNKRKHHAKVLGQVEAYG